MAPIHYTGIGSRETPPNVLNLMQRLGRRFAELGFVLRSGGAHGADKAFEAGCDDAGGAKEVWLPWEGYENNSSKLFPTVAAFEMAAQHHPAWARLNSSQRPMLARNCHQVLGANLATPSSFVICWTKDGCESAQTRSIATGGTGTAIEIANVKGVPVFNLFNEGAMARLTGLVEEIKARRSNQSPQETRVEYSGHDEFIEAVINIFDAEVLSVNKIGD